MQDGATVEHFYYMEADWNRRGGRGRKHAMNKGVQRTNTRGLSSGKFAIDLQGKQMR